MSINNLTNYKYNSNTALKNQVHFQGWQSLAEKAASAPKSILKVIDYKDSSLSLYALTLICFGVVVGSRALKARNDDEKREVLYRDVPSVGTIIYGIPVIGKVIAKAMQEISGIPVLDPLLNEKSSSFKSFLKYINPFSSFKLIDADQLDHWYNKVKSLPEGERITMFCKQQDKNGGNLWKMFQFLDESSKKAVNTIAEELLVQDKAASEGFFLGITRWLRQAPDTLAEIPHDNNKIIKMFEDAKTKATSGNKIIETALKTIEDSLHNVSRNKNNLYRAAEFCKNIPVAAGFLVTGLLLGVAIPALNIRYTTNIYKKGKNQKDQNEKKVENDFLSNNNSDLLFTQNSYNQSKNFTFVGFRKDLFAEFQN